ncbi:MAG: hypothetical protein RIS20_748 [Bacteroidota bacterium]|jgi:hypothetical protein
MKNLVLFGILSLAQVTFAQKGQSKRIVQIQGNDTTVIIINERMDKMDSILTEEMKKIYVNDSMVTRVDVFIDSTIISEDGQASMDSIKVKIGNMKIVILDDRNGDAKGQKRMIIDERVIINEDRDISFQDEEMKEDDCNSCSSNTSNPVWSGIGITANGFMNTQNKVATGSELGFLELDPARSIGVQLNVFEKRFPIIKDYLGVTTGLGIQWNRYALKGNYDITTTNDTIFGVENTSVQYSKNVLSSAYLQAPLLLQINTNKNASESWTIAAGVVGGIRVGGLHKTKWEVDGNQNKDKTKDDFNFKPFSASLMALIGYGQWNLYMTYNLTDVFNEGSALSLRGVNAGILLSF